MPTATQTPLIPSPEQTRSESVAPTADTSPTLVTSGQSRTQYATNVNKMQAAATNYTAPATSTTAAVDTNYFLKPGETIDAYNTRVASYNAVKAAPQEEKPTDQPPSPPAKSPVDASGASSNAPDNSSGTQSSDAAMVDSAALSPDATKAFNDSLTNLNDGIANAKATIDAAKATLANDPELQLALDDVTRKYDTQIQIMKDRNRIVIGSDNVNAARGGSLQFANEMNTNFMSEEQGKADKRVNDLIAEEQDLLLKTKIAYQNKDVKALDDAQTAYDKANADKLSAIRDLIKATHDRVSELQEQQKIDQTAKQDEYKQQQDKITTALKVAEQNETVRHNQESESVAKENAATSRLSASKGIYQLKDNADGTQSIFDTRTGAMMGVPTNDVPNGNLKPGQTGDPLLDANTRSSKGGVPYIDGTNLAGKQAANAQLQAAKLGIPYLNKTQASAVQEASTVHDNLDTIQGILSSISSSNFATRPLNNALLKVESKTQADADVASLDSFQLTAIPLLRAMANGTSGLRITNTEFQKALQSMPKSTDTVAVVNQKVSFIKSILANGERGMFGDKVYEQYNPDAAVKDLTTFTKSTPTITFNGKPLSTSDAIKQLRAAQPNLTPYQVLQILRP